jgi:hypothetical protein
MSAPDSVTRLGYLFGISWHMKLIRLPIAEFRTVWVGHEDARENKAEAVFGFFPFVSKFGQG